ncbi:hypothetical protein [Tamlana flava]|uniref:hypothetical protein n=1 Tax=Tamlana flava TaxID=3158572 RepID=UPI00351BA0F0
MKNVMKHLKKGILMATLMAASLSFAKEKASVFMITKDAKMTSIALRDVKKGNLLFIKDDNGAILYKESIQKTGLYNKGFDLTSLPDGDYHFVLDKDLEINSIPFSVKLGLVEFNKEDEKTSYKPYVRLKGNLLYVTKLALNKEPLIIDIYYTGHDIAELMYSKELKGTQTPGEIFKLTGLRKGSYKIVMHSEGRKFVENIN